MQWGALNNASTAMMAMSWGMGSISQNIANVNTTAYKRKETEFKTVMSEGKTLPTHGGPGAATTGSGMLSIFGVATKDYNRISDQGVISPTSTWSDLAINGKGFFMVAAPGTAGAPPTSATTDEPGAILYTRDGGFGQYAYPPAPDRVARSSVTSTYPAESPGENSRSYFVTGGGMYLLGWKADSQGVIDGIATSERSGLAPQQTLLTDEAAATLEPVYIIPNSTVDGVSTTAIRPVVNLPANATPTVSTVYKSTTVSDSGGTSQTLDMIWRRTGADTWSVEFGTPDGATSVTPSSTEVTLAADGSISLGATPSVDITWTSPAGTTSSSLDLTGLQPDRTEVPLTLTVYDDAYKAHSVNAFFENAGGDTWYMRLRAADGTVTADTQEIIFNGDAQLDAASADSTTFSIAWTSGLGTGDNEITMDLSRLTQFTDKVAQVNIRDMEQDGYGRGQLTGASFNSNGELIGHFTNGHMRTLFKVPVATFVAIDNMDPVSGNLFARSAAAGDISISSIERQGATLEDGVWSNGTSSIVSSALEMSNVAIEDEFTRMIVTQKAYSSNATVFKTADEMTTTARDLKA